MIKKIVIQVFAFFVLCDVRLLNAAPGPSEPAATNDDFQKAKAVVITAGKYFAQVGGIMAEKGGLDEQKVLRMIAVVGDLIAQFHPVGTVLAAVVRTQIKPNRTDFELLLKEFQAVHERLDQIDNKLDRVENAIKEESAFAQYKRDIQKAKIQIQAVAKAYAKAPTEDTLAQYRSACERKQPIGLISLLSNQVTSNDRMGTSLFTAIYSASNMDRRVLHQYVVELFKDVSELGFLASTCTGIIGKETSPQQYKTYGAETKKVFQQIFDQLKKYDIKLLSEWPDKAAQEFKDAVSKKNAFNEKDVANIYSTLATKYYWVTLYAQVAQIKQGSLFTYTTRWNADYCSVEKKNNTEKCDVVNKNGTNLSGYRTLSLPDKDKMAVLAWNNKSYENEKLRTAIKGVFEDTFRFKKCEWGGKVSSEMMVDNIRKKINFDSLKLKWMYVIEGDLSYISLDDDATMYTGTHRCSYRSPANVEIPVYFQFVIGL